MPDELLRNIKTRIRDVKDFPKPGIVFKDLTPVLEDPALFHGLNSLLAAKWKDAGIEKVVAIESRGFIFGAPLAMALGAGLCLVRKAGKLPSETHSTAYALEYGEATVELHVDAVGRGEKALIVDDLLATGGTALAAAKLVHACGGLVAGYAFVVELDFLKGAQRLAPAPVESLLHF